MPDKPTGHSGSQDISRRTAIKVLGATGAIGLAELTAAATSDRRLLAKARRHIADWLATGSEYDERHAAVAVLALAGFTDEPEAIAAIRDGDHLFVARGDLRSRLSVDGVTMDCPAEVELLAVPIGSVVVA
jgi:hypothetical protein